MLILLLASATTLADDFVDGVTAYDRGDYATAFSKWKPLAEQGDADAQCSLGWMYFNGKGVPQDDKQAVYWYRKGAEQGNAWAQYNLGLMYRLGQGVVRDHRQAIYWYNQAAEQGLTSAQYNLGLMYNVGKGVPRDYVQAYMWWSLSAAQGNEGGRRKLDILAEKMTHEQIAEAQRLAREWMPSLD
jgi:TPR repeat protein